MGQTKVTDAALKTVGRLPKLKQLWLNETVVTDKGLQELANLKALRELHLEGSKVTAAGVAKLKKQLPACEILDKSKPKPE